MRFFLAIAAAVGLLLLSGASPAYAQVGDWSSGTARAIPKGRVEVGLLGPLKVGLFDRLELSAQPILFFVSPHLDARWTFADDGHFALAFEPSLLYPTPILRLLSKPGIGLYPADAEIPHSLIVRAGFAASVDHGASRTSTFRSSLSLGLRGEANNFPLLEFPFLYPRLAPLHSPLTARFEVRSEGVIVGPFDYLLHASIFVLPAVEGGWAFEQGGFARWRFHDRFALSLGYLLSLARYPYGVEVHALPLLEFEVVLRHGDARRNVDEATAQQSSETTSVVEEAEASEGAPGDSAEASPGEATTSSAGSSSSPTIEGEEPPRAGQSATPPGDP